MSTMTPKAANTGEMAVIYRTATSWAEHGLIPLLGSYSHRDITSASISLYMDSELIKYLLAGQHPRMRLQSSNYIDWHFFVLTYKGKAFPRRPPIVELPKIATFLTMGLIILGGCTNHH